MDVTRLNLLIFFVSSLAAVRIVFSDHATSALLLARAEITMRFLRV